MPREQTMFKSWQFLSDITPVVDKLSDMRYIAYQTVPENDMFRGWVYTENLRSDKYMLAIVPSFTWFSSSSIVRDMRYVESKRLGQLVEIGSAPSQGKRVDLEGNEERKRKREEASVSVMKKQKDECQAKLEALALELRDLKQAHQDLEQANQDHVRNTIEFVKTSYNKTWALRSALASIYKLFPLKVSTVCCLEGALV
jgi:hypothetical protein